MEDFKTCITGKAEKGWKVFMCGTRLYNFSNVEEVNNILTDDASHGNIEPVLEIAAQVNLSAIPSKSIMQDIVVEEIARMGLSRPVYNLEQNRI